MKRLLVTCALFVPSFGCGAANSDHSDPLAASAAGGTLGTAGSGANSDSRAHGAGTSGSVVAGSGGSASSGAGNVTATGGQSVSGGSNHGGACACAGSGGGAGASETGGASGQASSGAPSTDPLSATPTCTSMTSWSSGNQGTSAMNPGLACITCHRTSGGKGPSFSIAGTVYPTGHEPDRCNSNAGSDGARIVLTGADGETLTLTPNWVGNFNSQVQIKTPFRAKVTYNGRERVMLTPQTSGDCNSCHTQAGTSMAPGRITVP